MGISVHSGWRSTAPGKNLFCCVFIGGLNEKKYTKFIIRLKKNDPGINSDRVDCYGVRFRYLPLCPAGASGLGRGIYAFLHGVDRISGEPAPQPMSASTSGSGSS